jgi:hypothetical protein
MGSKTLAWRELYCLTAMVLVGLAVPTSALSATKPTPAKSTPTTLTAAKPTVLHWHAEVRGGGYLMAADDYVWTDLAVDPETTGTGTLINGLTGKQTASPHPARYCQTDPLGSTTGLTWDCDQPDASLPSGAATAAAIYDPNSGAWTVPDPMALDQKCDQQQYTGCEIMAAGTDWIEWDLTQGSSPGDDHPRKTYFYENITTGALETAADVLGGGKWANLDTAGLASKLCTPLRVPASYPELGSIAFDGRFGLLSAPGEPGKTWLQQCGSKTKTFIQTPYLTPVDDSKLVAWIGADGAEESHTISYIQLPSLKRGTWKIPTSLPTDISGINIAGNRIFISVGISPINPEIDGEVYSAALPAADR